MVKGRGGCLTNPARFPRIHEQEACPAARFLNFQEWEPPEEDFAEVAGNGSTIA